ncbi:hypothetical protein GLAREA_03746 [Glarea lozoyensis ATCC 20868]|uniref:Uncharacterized protein n=1 Tax=Glarea lozoyensis (strain ATCC 20868 / MF5171) TaxID=1116229 RepID=S3D0X0_GLAL2|nr:uncharacterized protein GLAREA_03746 [Glarea lozoyensis ATCC 20868]EPE30779.1 hypothetical protein GLAREA_03746 [Glarea lozoyensis ATCC 20868]
MHLKPPNRFLNTLLKHWHHALALKPQHPTWYRPRLIEELQEVRDAKTLIMKTSERSDVLFCLLRGRLDGVTGVDFCGVRGEGTGVEVVDGGKGGDEVRFGVLVWGYMVGKFTLRCAFYAVVGLWFGRRGEKGVREVVNPGRERKLVEVAERHGIDPKKFVRVSKRLLRVWPLLP